MVGCIVRFLLCLTLVGCGTETTFSDSLRDAYAEFRADASPTTTPSYVSWSALLEAAGEGACLEPRVVFTPEGAGLLRRVMGAFASVDPATLPSANDRVAFWINAHNALVLRTVASLAAERPEGTVGGGSNGTGRVAGQLTEAATLSVAGRRFTAEWIRHGVLRGDFSDASLRDAPPDVLRAAHRDLWPDTPDPRIHFALACGARSCPDLPAAPLEGATLDASLDRLTRAFLADPERGAGPNGVSALFHWYAADFRAIGGVPAFLARHGALRGTDPGGVLPWDWRRPPAPAPEACAQVAPVDTPDAGALPVAECSGDAVEPCGPLAAVGACRPGESHCVDGRFSECSGAVEPTDERCNGVDDDCDGTTDEEPVPDARPCPERGVCAQADVRCAAGAWICDLPLAHEAAEVTCDGLDNDCDGTTDEGAVPPADIVCAGVGLCSEAAAACEAGVWACQFPAGYEVGGEVRCDGVDEDCDAVIDENIEGCTCADGSRRPCGRTEGACTEGEQLCAGGTWGSCSGVTPRDEVCDGIDNDCDGAVDDGVANTCGECGPAPLEVCDGADQDCDGRMDEGVSNACGGCGEAPVEACNGGDDDCDGRTDEGVANACGTCGDAAEEVCNGLDDDCDGQVDEGLEAPPGIACPSEGVCADAVPGCAGAEGFGCRFPDDYEEIEASCDFRDNDCDGQIDEGLLNRCDFCGPPPRELCNHHRDDDCDGIADEGCPIDPNSQPMRE